MIIFYYIACLLEVFLKAWADSEAFTGGDNYHLADVLHYASLAIMFGYIYTTWNNRIKEMALLSMIYILIRFAWFDYFLNMFRALDFDYKLFLYNVFGDYSGLTRIVAMLAVVVFGYVYWKDKKMEYYEKG